MFKKAFILMIKRTAITRSCFFIFALHYVGCSNSGGSDGNLNLSFTHAPKVGSTFTFNNIPVDTNGVASNDPPFISKDSVVETGITFEGKSNVMHILEVTPYLKESYINFESNGDISIYDADFHYTAGWITYPVQTQKTIVLKPFDTTISWGGFRYTTSDTIEFIGMTNWGIDFQVLSCAKVIASFNEVITDQRGVTNNNNQNYFLFAPSIGYFTHYLPKAKSTGGVSLHGIEKKLISFFLR